MSHFFTSSGLSPRASASASVLPMNIQSWFPLGLIGLISLQSKEFSRAFSSITVRKHQFSGAQPSSKTSILWCSAFFAVQLSHLYMTLGKSIALTAWIFVTKVMFLLVNTLSRFVIAFLPRSKCLWISWLQSASPVLLESKKIKSVTVSTLFPSTCHESDGTQCHDLNFLNVEF